MSYVLVLQWPPAVFKDFDAMIAVENALIDGLSEVNEVDGHDIGAGQFNIFVRTDNPNLAFEEARAILPFADTWADARAAYRGVAESDYTVIWPPGLTDFRVS